MIKTDATNGSSLKEIKDRERKTKEAELHAKCTAIANDRYTEDQMKKWSNDNKGLFFLPCMDDDGNIEKLAIMKPITRHILSYASTKMTDGGLYDFLEAAMRECFIAGDNEILEEDDYFIPAANSFNKILEGKKANLLKR